jgi:hypothetical protein
MSIDSKRRCAESPIAHRHLNFPIARCSKRTELIAAMGRPNCFINRLSFPAILMDYLTSGVNPIAAQRQFFTNRRVFQSDTVVD